MNLNFLDALLPMLPNLSLGAILGFCAGYALKKMGRFALLLMGLLFIAVQILASQGFVTVHWPRIEAAATPWLARGGQAAGAWGLNIIQTNLPFGAAFAAALLLGLRAR